MILRRISVIYRLSFDGVQWTDWGELDLQPCTLFYDSESENPRSNQETCNQDSLQYKSKELEFGSFFQHIDYCIFFKEQVDGVELKSMGMSVGNLVPAEKSDE